MIGTGSPAWQPLSVLVDPGGTLRRAVADPHPAVLAAGLFAALSVLGLATLPRQIHLLAEALPPTGDWLLDDQQAELRAGVLRLVVADRLVASPTLLLAVLLLAWAAEPVLMLARERRDAIWTTVLLGLAPLLVQRVGELAICYLAAQPGGTAGDAVTLPHRFVTGPLLLWRGGPPPLWLQRLDARADLILVWSVLLWTLGLRQLDGGRLRTWHVALPAACAAGAAVVTWVLGPVALGAVLRAG